MSNVYSNIHLQAWNTFCKSPVTPARAVAGITTKIALQNITSQVPICVFVCLCANEEGIIVLLNKFFLTENCTLASNFFLLQRAKIKKGTINMDEPCF